MFLIARSLQSQPMDSPRLEIRVYLSESPLRLFARTQMQSRSSEVLVVDAADADAQATAETIEK